MSSNTDYGDEDVIASLSHRVSEQEGGQLESMPAQDATEAERALESIGAVALWYPKADRSIAMPTQGTYAGKYPIGAVVHFTAGRSLRGDKDARLTVEDGAKKKHCYFCVSATGKVFQTAPLSHWGWHCGSSHYPGLGNNLSNRIVGIEVCNAGRLTKTANGFESWWNKDYPEGSKLRTYFQEAEVRRVEKAENVRVAGHFHAYTKEQEEALIDLLMWLYTNNPSVFKIDYIVGHDEISPGRKDDPGGALLCLMPELRAQMLARVAGV